jgi:hypothetical protein
MSFLKYLKGYEGFKVGDRVSSKVNLEDNKNVTQGMTGTIEQFILSNDQGEYKALVYFDKNNSNSSQIVGELHTYHLNKLAKPSPNTPTNYYREELAKLLPGSWSLQITSNSVDGEDNVRTKWLAINEESSREIVAALLMKINSDITLQKGL